jgi:hypothetical protein
MKNLAASILIGPLMLIGPLPAAGQSSLVFGAGAPVQVAAGEVSTADKDTYMQKVKDELQEWDRKLHKLGEKGEAEGKEAANTAENDLDRAWTRTEAESRKLRTVGAEGWESAKSSFEHASHELAEAWNKSHPGDK